MYFYMWTGIQKHLFQEHASAWTVTNTSTHTQGISPWACSNADGRAGALGANFARRETALKVLGSLSKSSALTTAPAGPQHQSSIRHGGLTSLFPSPTLFFSSPQFFFIPFYISSPPFLLQQFPTSISLLFLCVKCKGAQNINHNHRWCIWPWP